MLAASDLIRFVPNINYSGSVAPLNVYGLDSAYTGNFNVSNVNVATLLTSNPSDFVDPSTVAINTAILATPVAQWINASGGSWTSTANAGADWSTGSVPISTDDVVIALSGSAAYTVTITSGASASATSLTVNSPNAILLDQGTLTLTGTLMVSSGIFDLANGGSVSGGTLQATGGSFTWNGGTLSGVTYDGTMNLSSSSSSVIVANGLTMFGVGGTGSGAINLTGQSSILYAEGTETLNNATLNIGNNSTDYLYNYDNSAAAVLTLGPTLTIDQTGSNANLSGYFDRSGSGIVNDGTINADFTGGTFTIGDVSFTNAGTINVSSGDTVNVTATSFNNSGALIVNGGTLDVTEAVTGSGSATISGDGKLEVQGADAQTVTFSGTGGALELASPTSFTGEIAGVTGTGDILDLKGYDASTTASTAGGYNSTTNTTTLTVTDPGHTTLNFTLAGNLSASAWTVTPDSNNAGVDIVDPPAASPSNASTPNFSGALHEFSDTSTFTGPDISTTLKTSFAPERSNYFGTFYLVSLWGNHGSASVKYGFMPGNDQNLPNNQTVTQSYDVSVTNQQNATTVAKEVVSVSIGGPGNDQFVFHPGVGADTSSTSTRRKTFSNSTTSPTFKPCNNWHPSSPATPTATQ